MKRIQENVSENDTRKQNSRLEEKHNRNFENMACYKRNKNINLVSRDITKTLQKNVETMTAKL